LRFWEKCFKILNKTEKSTKNDKSMKTDELWFCKNTEKQSAAETASKYMGKRFYVFMKLYNFYLCSGERAVGCNRGGEKCAFLMNLLCFF
jgi:hypothetical protein